ncbi:MAG: hypothetical protein OEZ54_01580 [Gemmatimonadota bacterium]|nr:hypothetical protein [Gemmatimonadota bacterium]
MSHVDEGQIQAYLDRQLEFADEAERKRLEYHLSRCLACTELLRESREISERSAAILNALPDQDFARPPFEDVVQLAERAERVIKQKRLSTMTRLAWAATVIVAVGTGVYVRPYLMKDHAEAPSEVRRTIGEDDVRSTAPIAPVATEEIDEMDEAVTERDAAPVGAGPTTVPSGAAATETQAQSLDPKSVSGNVTASDEVSKTTVGRAAPAADAVASQEGFRSLQESPRPVAPPSPVAAPAAPRSRMSQTSAGAEAMEREASPSAVGLADMEEEILWEPANLQRARGILESPVLLIPDLPVRRIFVSQGNAKAVMIVQEMDDGTRITLWEEVNTGGPQANRAPPSNIEGNHSDVIKGGLWITAWAPFSADEIQALLGRLVEAPDAN